MSLLDREDLQNLHEFIRLVYPVKCSPCSPDMQPVQDITILKAELLLFTPLPGKRIFTQCGQFCPDNSPALFIKTVDFIDLLPFDT
jgi:hypothetical protein